MTDVDTPTWIAELELSDPLQLQGLSRRPSSEYRWARVMIRLRHIPIGFLEVPVPPQGLSAEAVAERAVAQFRDAIHDPHSTASAEASHVQPPMSIVVCTRNRPDVVARCLRSLQALDYEAFEVLVVDNAPDDDDTQRRFAKTVGDDGRFRYVREPARGVSHARNRGLSEASFDHVAFTDDDVQVDPWWLVAIARGFAREPDVGCVTGLVPAASLDDPSEHYFDRYMGWSERLTPRCYDTTTRRSKHFPFDAGLYGTGANFAVDGNLVADIGGLDVALGVGSPACGGEDLDLFVRVLRAGRVLAYEPAAIVWHFHRSDASDLRQQMRSYGVGFVAYISKQLRDPAARWFFVRHAPRGAAFITGRWIREARARPGGARFAIEELWGYLLGSLAYRRAQRASSHSPK